MDAPDKKQPRKHFFKIPTNFYELSDEEQSAWTLQLTKLLHGEIVEGEKMSSDYELAMLQVSRAGLTINPEDLAFVLAQASLYCSSVRFPE